MKGEVPLLGGNPLTGAAELYEATKFSIASSLKGRTKVLMVNPVEMPSPLRDAAALDMDKIQVLIEHSELSIADVSKYLTLIKETQRIIERKESALNVIRVHAMGPIYMDSAIYEYKSAFELCMGEGEDCYPTALLWDVRKLEDRIGYTFRSPTLAVMAITHDLMTPGGESNRVLAHVGDSTFRCITGLSIYARDGVVVEVDRVIQQYQNNVAFRDAGISLGLQEFIRAAKGIDTSTKRIMATVVEALCGAIWIDSEYNLVKTFAYGSLVSAWPETIRATRKERSNEMWWDAQDKLAQSWTLEELSKKFEE
jgi:dsRNA-specific ribonuclease